MAGDNPRFVVLDRDGVVNRESAAFIRSPAEWLPLPGSLEAIATLTRAGFDVVVASNQSGIGRGFFDLETLKAIHRKMTMAVEDAGGRLAGIFFCPHLPEDDCDCRKPRPGLLRQIERQFGISLAGRPVVGDSLRDLEAALAVGAQPMLVRTGNGVETERQLGGLAGILVFADLPAVAEHLLADQGKP